MAVYGLGGLDLNWIARAALLGLLDKPEARIAELMRSPQPIEKETRVLLAEALEGKSKTGIFTLSDRTKGQVFRQFRKKRKQIQLGREVRKLQAAGHSLEDAKEAVEKLNTHEWSASTIGDFATLSHKLDRWIGEARKAGAAHSDIALECAFIYEMVGNNNSDHPIKPSLEYLAAIMTDIEDQLRGVSETKFVR